MEKELQEISETFGLRFIVLFGSFVSELTHKESDTDIAIYPENGIEKDAAKLEQRFGQFFHTPRIDLVNLKTAGPLLQKEVATKGKLLYAKDKASFPLFQMYAMRAYYDFAPYLRLREQTIQKRLNKLSA